MIFGSHGWHWFGIWKRFGKKSKIGGNLDSVSMSPLVNSFLVNLVKVSTGGQQQSGSS
jgi:hypothetical protein